MRSVCECRQHFCILQIICELLQPFRDVSQAVSPCLFVVLIFCFWFWDYRVGFLALDHKYRHFVNLLDSKKYSMSLAETMWKTNLRWSLTTILGKQQERNFPSCTELFSHLGSDVALDHWSTHVNNRALHRVCQDGRRVVEYLHRHEEIKTVNKNLCFLMCLHFPSS